jgi:hypothetical protein
MLVHPESALNTPMRIAPCVALSIDGLLAGGLLLAMLAGGDGSGYGLRRSRKIRVLIGLAISGALKETRSPVPQLASHK